AAEKTRRTGEQRYRGRERPPPDGPPLHVDTTTGSDRLISAVTPTPTKKAIAAATMQATMTVAAEAWLSSGIGRIRASGHCEHGSGDVAGLWCTSVVGVTPARVQHCSSPSDPLAWHHGRNCPALSPAGPG